MRISEAITMLAHHGIERAAGDVEFHLRRIASLAQCEIGDELVYLYENLDGGWLFDGDVRLLPIGEVENVGELQGGEYGRLCTPSSWVAIMDAMNGDYIAIDLVSNKVLDCDHADLGSARVIAHSLSDFLEQFFSQAPERFWPGTAFSPLETLAHPASDALNRHLYRYFWNVLGEDLGPELCNTNACARGRIALGSKCRKHHYEMVRGHSCPFE
jgi:hypothetical protein